MTLRSRLQKYTVLISAVVISLTAQQSGAPRSKVPYPETLTYRVEWRLITAGAATMSITNPAPNQWHTDLNIQSAGIMTRLYRVLDEYKVKTDSAFCGISADMDEEEGKRHLQTHLILDTEHRKAKYDERDLLKNTSKHSEVDVPACAHEITGALTNLRTLSIEPGKSVTIPITNGKKVANARIESQAKEALSVDGKTYQTIRYEAYLFDNVLYRRKGRLLIWLTDDADRIPIQVRLQMGFPIGNVSIILEKEARQ